MFTFTTPKFLFLFLSTFLLISCENDEDIQIIDPVNYNNKCLLTDVKTIQGNFQYNSSFEYDAQRNVAKMNYADNTGSSTSKINYLIETNATGKVTKLTGYVNGSVASIKSYEYHPNGLLKKVSFYESALATGAPVLRAYETYEYNSANQLEKRNGYNQMNELNYYDIFTYPAANAAKKVNFHVINNDTFPTRGFSEYTFDNKKNVMQLVGGLYEVGELYGEGLFSSHNPLTLRIIDPGIDTVENSYAYTYNADDYPTSRTTLVKGQTANTTTYTYSCQ